MLLTAYSAVAAPPLLSQQEAAASLAPLKPPCACFDCNCFGQKPPPPDPAKVDDEDPDQCAVVVGSNYDTRLELFAVGDDGQVYHRPQRSHGRDWDSWAPIQGAPALRGGLAVVRAQDRLIVGLCGTDGSLHVAAQAEPNGSGGRWAAFRPIGGPPGGCKHRPTLIVGRKGELHLFAVGDTTSAGQLWHASWPWNGGVCDYRQLVLYASAEAALAAGCGEWALLGGEATDAPSVVESAGLLHVFVRGPGGALFQKVELPAAAADATTTTAWGNWSALEGSASSTPRLPVLTSGTSVVELYYRGYDHALWQLRQGVPTGVPEAQAQAQAQAQPVEAQPPPLGWSSPQPLGGVVASGPAAGANVDNLAHVVALGPDRTVWHKRQFFDPKTLSAGWYNWGSLGGEASSGPTVATTGDGLLEVFIRGTDRNLYRKPQLFDPANATDGAKLRWGSWEFLGGPMHSFPC